MDRMCRIYQDLKAIALREVVAIEIGSDCPKTSADLDIARTNDTLLMEDIRRSKRATENDTISLKGGKRG